MNGFLSACDTSKDAQLSGKSDSVFGFFRGQHFGAKTPKKPEKTKFLNFGCVLRPNEIDKVPISLYIWKAPKKTFSTVPHINP